MIPGISTDELKSLFTEANKNGNGNGKTKYEKDKSFYNLSINDYFKTSNEKKYNSIIRFLPPAEGEVSPFIKLMKHSIKMNKKFFGEDCVRFVDPDAACAGCEFVKEKWPTADEDMRKMLKRKIYYVSNILVIKDAQRPEIEGKVMLFRYGKDIFSKITNKINPPEDGAISSNIFHYLEGRNFKVRINKDGNIWKYDQSEFDDQSKLFGGNEQEINTVHSKLFKLNDIVEKVKKISFENSMRRIDNMVRADILNEVEEVETVLDDRHVAVEKEVVEKTVAVASVEKSLTPVASSSEEDEFWNKL